MRNAPSTRVDEALSDDGKALKLRSFSLRRRSPQALNRTLPPPPARLRRLAAALHSLGPRPLYEYLVELADGADAWERLERYAELSPLASFIAANDGDRLPPLRIVGGRR
jgi:hypothetical protein